MKLGALQLDIARRRLTGPRGTLDLQNQPFLMCERLMRRPDVIVTTPELITTIYPEPGDEPDAPEVMIRQIASQVRAALKLLGAGVEIKGEHRIGYRMRERE